VQPDLNVELAAAWAEKAGGDLAMARAGLASAQVPAWAIGFHCQQAVEKCLKAWIALHGSAPPSTHDLQRLAGAVGPDAEPFPLDTLQMARLQPFAVSERYPVLRNANVERADTEALAGDAERSVAWIERELRRRSDG